MRFKRIKLAVFFAGALLFTHSDSINLSAQQTKRPFTVADEIGLTLVIGEGEPCTRFSPDGAYVVMFSERGRVEANRVENSLRFYRTQDIRNFLAHPEQLQSPEPVWTVERSAVEAGTSGEDIISGWRWLANSRGVAFLEETADGNWQLVLADLGTKTVEVLTSATESVQKFDVRDATHYVYTAAATTGQQEPRADRQGLVVVGTGLSLPELVFPDDPNVASLHSHRSYVLWAVMGGNRFEVKQDGTPVLPGGDLALSPDGQSLVTEMPIPEVPKSWETLYPPSFPSSPYRIHAGRGSAKQYVRLDLQTGLVQPLTDAPTGWDAGWWTRSEAAAWSSDGREIALPGTFIKSKEDSPTRPCVAIVDLPTGASSCVETLKARTATGVEDGYHMIYSVRFGGQDGKRVMVAFQKHGEDWWSMGTNEYRRTTEGAWQKVGESDGVPGTTEAGLEVTVKQAFNQPPLLIASDQKASRVIWDPNPQLRNMAWGEAGLYTWKDKEGRVARGGLFKPPHYQAGQRYPLVIQTHGFDGSLFFPSGSFPSAFAASELASAGIMVLQPDDIAAGCSEAVAPREGPCAVSTYEAAAEQLVSEGLVDPERIGIIGFSRSCYYVMETLTTSSLHLKAASVTDGVMLDYFQTMQDPEGSLGEGNTMVGAPPFGEGLQSWLKRSPGFNLDKVQTPLRVVGIGRPGLLSMWGPYAGLHYLKKPVDLILLNASAHVLTNPAQRLAAQTGTVDWFRFWLQGYEDPDSAKAEQYKRWRELRKLQEENEKKPTPPAN